MHASAKKKKKTVKVFSFIYFKKERKNARIDTVQKYAQRLLSTLQAIYLYIKCFVYVTVYFTATIHFTITTKAKKKRNVNKLTD